ncbi:hypothetical protein KY319_03515 [Candidatus Woesearchaeota archaeon]|nr:hypothetical protein [Candidatus Woesearchaeota archaeon]
MTILFSVLLVLSTVAALPLSVERATIDNTEIEPLSVNLLDIERDQDFTLKLQLLAVEDVKDVEIRAFISGYEYNDVNAISDRIGPFDFSENVTYIKKLTLALPDNVDVDEYYLRLVISDRYADEIVQNYRLSVNSKRHELKIQDITLNANTITAGQALLATVRLENQGQRDEDDVKVVVSIPSLNLTGTDYVEEIESDEEEETEEIFLRLPKCAEPGMYQVNVEAFYNDDHDKVTGSTKVTILENEACNPEPAPVVIVEDSNQPAAPVAVQTTNKVRSALEIILLVLVALLVIVGLIIGFTRMRE